VRRTPCVARSAASQRAPRTLAPSANGVRPALRWGRDTPSSAWPVRGARSAALTVVRTSIQTVCCLSLARTLLEPNQALPSVPIRRVEPVQRAEAHGFQRMPRDQPSEAGGGVGRDTPGVGGSIPSQPRRLTVRSPMRTVEAMRQFRLGECRATAALSSSCHIATAGP
jgi:hypothetical protein